MNTPKQIIDFWVKDVGPKGWYMGEAELDQMIVDRFGADYDAARDGKHADWEENPEAVWQC